MEQNYCKKYHDGGTRTDLIKCTLCNVDCNTMEQFNIHTSGKIHKKNLKAESFIGIGNNFTCEPCNMNMNCKEQYDAHCNGAKHQKKIASTNYPCSSSVGKLDNTIIDGNNMGNTKIEKFMKLAKQDLTDEVVEEIKKALQEDFAISEKVENFEDGNSPLDLAKQNNHQSIIEILNSAKCDLILKKQIASMGLICSEICDHNFCSTSFTAKSFSKGQLLRRNNNIEVYRCKASLTGREFAIKCIPVNDIDKNNSRNIEENVNYYLEVLQHVRIVQYFGAIEAGMHLCIFMEFLSRGSLDDEIKRRKIISTENVIRYSCQISEGLSYLHGKKIIHRDIKPGNILLDEADNIRLVDFGISRLLTRTDGHTTNTKSICGTPNFMAPEVIHGEEYTFFADIWSLGATMINMISGNPPYHSMIREAVIFRIGTNKTLELPTENISKPMKELIEEMINPDPKLRPRASDLANPNSYQ